MTLRQKEYVCIAVLTAGLFLMLVFGESIPLLLLGLVTAFASMGLYLAWWRCPHCGQYLRLSHGRYCPNCGREIDYDAKP